MDLSNLSEQASKAAAAAKAAGISALGNSKEAIDKGIETIKEKVGEKANLSESAKEKLGEVLHKGADALEGLADKLK